ncbi:CU044_2847 family protein [Streptomyces sp. NPDC058864]
MPIDIPVFADGPGTPDTPPQGDALYDDIRTRGRAGRALDPDHLVRGVYGPALELAEEAVRQAARRFAALGRVVRPDEIEMQFGVTMKGEGTVGIAKAGAEAQIRFTFRWDTAPTGAHDLPRQRAEDEAVPQGDEAEPPETPGSEEAVRGTEGEPGREVTHR